MKFKFIIENKEFSINIEDKEDYQIMEMEICKNIVIYPVWFSVVGFSNGKQFCGLIGVSENIFDEGNDFLNKYITVSISNRLDELNQKQK